MSDPIKVNRERIKRISTLLNQCGSPACTCHKIQELSAVIQESTPDEIALATIVYCRAMLLGAKQTMEQMAVTQATAECDAYDRVH